MLNRNRNIIKKIKILFFWETVIFNLFFEKQFRSSFLLKKLNAFNHQFLERHQHIYIACFPKSGSTFLYTVLGELTKHEKNNFVYAYQRTEQEIYYPALLEKYDINTITQQHSRATEANIKLMKEFSIAPIVLIRNIFDVVISMRDHIVNERVTVFAFYADENFFKLNEKTQYDFIIELGLPWYINFFVSWFEAQKKNDINTLLVTYEELMSDKIGTISKILKYYNVSKNLEEIEMALDSTKNRKTRFNKGIVGRGSEILSPEQKEKINSYKKFYPHIDFSKIGM